MPITLLDGILIAIMLISALLAMFRGFAREVLSIASWVAAAVAAFMLYESLLPIVKGYISNQQIALGVSVAAIFFVTLIIVSYVTMKISDFILDSRIGALDRTLGFVFGAARGLLLVVVGMMFLNWLVPERTQPSWIAKAKSKPLLNSIGEQLVAVLPEDPESKIFDKLRNPDKNSLPDDTQSSAPPKGDPGYQTSERRVLDQLIKSSDN